MKIFLDTANIDEISTAWELGVIQGVTTNPTLIAREKKDIAGVIREICQIVTGPVSAEVISTRAAEIVPEAHKLASIAPNVVVKVPMTPEGLKAVKVLAAEGIKTNVTLVFSANQALLAAQAGATYISPFIGRLDDIGHDGMGELAQILQIITRYQLSTEVIAASIRHPQHVTAAALLGAHIATIPHKVLMQMFQHPLTDLGIEKFLFDWQQANKS